MPICNIHVKAGKPSYLHLPCENDQSLGAELKRRRLALKWTQYETAEHFGVRKDTYQKWEWNKYIPHIKHRKMVNEFLGYNYWDDGTNSLANLCLCYRIENGLTQKEIARSIGTSTTTIERIEKNTSFISFKLQNNFLEIIERHLVQ